MRRQLNRLGMVPDKNFTSSSKGQMLDRLTVNASTIWSTGPPWMFCHLRMSIDMDFGRHYWPLDSLGRSVKVTGQTVGNADGDSSPFYDWRIYYGFGLFLVLSILFLFTASFCIVRSHNFGLRIVSGYLIGPLANSNDFTGLCTIEPIV